MTKKLAGMLHHVLRELQAVKGMQEPCERCKQHKCCQMGLRSTVRAEKGVACARVISAVGGVRSCVVLAVLRKVVTRSVCQLAKMCTCVAVCWKCAKLNACAHAAGRVGRVHGYACARRARPVVCPRAERSARCDG